LWYVIDWSVSEQQTRSFTTGGEGGCKSRNFKFLWVSVGDRFKNVVGDHFKINFMGDFFYDSKCCGSPVTHMKPMVAKPMHESYLDSLFTLGAQLIQMGTSRL